MTSAAERFHLALADWQSAMTVAQCARSPGSIAAAMDATDRTRRAVDDYARAVNEAGPSRESIEVLAVVGRVRDRLEIGYRWLCGRRSGQISAIGPSEKK